MAMKSNAIRRNDNVSGQKNGRQLTSLSSTNQDGDFSRVNAILAKPRGQRTRQETAVLVRALRKLEEGSK